MKYSEKHIASISQDVFTFTCIHTRHSSFLLAKTWFSIRNRISLGLFTRHFTGVLSVLLVFFLNLLIENETASISRPILEIEANAVAYIQKSLACVASVSNRVIARKLRAEAKKRLKGEGEGRRGNACPQTPRFWKTPLDISRFGSFVN